MRDKPENESRYELPGDVNKLVLGSLARIAGIQGVSTVWVFDNKATILSYFNRLKIDLQSITSSIAMLDVWADRVETSLDSENIKLVYIKFEKLLLFVTPITEDKALGIISSVNAPVGQIFWYLDRLIPQLQKIFTA
ncbi:MAG: roadblock/LC7 domain-containing protein [Candidatus Aquicultor sp.]